MSSRFWQILVAAIAGCAILIGLGIWQLQRLETKQALIARMEERRALPPVTLSEALNAAEATGQVDYLPISTQGRFAPDKEFLMLTTFDGSPGWRIVTPFRSDDGILVLVDRGVVPDSLRDPPAHPERNSQGEQDLHGYALWHRSKQAFFDPENDVSGNSWYWWDVPAMLADAGADEGLRAAPFVLHLDPKPGDRSFPRPVPPEDTLRNHHLQYALTWFALGLVLALLAGLAIRSDVKQGGRTRR